MGKGIFSYSNGDMYNGDWKNGVKEGKGTYKYHNGDKYIGDWKSDYKEGQGICIYGNKDKYEGGWKKEKVFIHIIMVKNMKGIGQRI